jgi:hypothetical protein
MRTLELDGLKNRFGQRLALLLVGLLPVVLVLAACSNSEVEVDVAPVEAIPEVEVAIAEVDEVPTFDEQLTDMAINVVLTDEGFEPSTIFVPAGRGIRLLVRNRGTTEHHYRVVGLVAEGLLWQSEPEGLREDGVTDDDHELHHDSAFVPFRATSRAGIRPFGDEVHAYASRSDVDVVLFTALERGTYMVECPLHPEVTGKMTVF